MKNIIIVSVLIAILAMAVGYSLLATQLKINETVEITGEWDVRIINIETKAVSEKCDPGTPQFTNTSVTFNLKLVKPGDSITYEITIKNEGTIDATLSTVVFLEELKGAPEINYVTTELNHELLAGEETTCLVTVEYKSGTTKTPEVKTKTLTGIIEYVQ